jgi:tetratricopeptide (TPR) repeat protein
VPSAGKDSVALAAAVSAARRVLKDTPEGDAPRDLLNRCTASYELGVALAGLGRYEEAVGSFRDAEEIAARTPGLERFRMVLGSRLAAALFQLDRYEEVVDVAGQVVGAGVDVGGLELTAAVEALRCRALVQLRRWPEADASGRALVEIAEPGASALLRGFVALGRYVEGVVARELGQPGLALPAVDEAIAAARTMSFGSDPGVVPPLSQMLLARAAVLEDLGRVADAKAAYADVIAESKRESDQTTRRKVWLARQRQLALLLGCPPPQTFTQRKARRRTPSGSSSP